MHRGPAAYVLGPPPSRSRDLELEGGVIALHVDYVYEPQDSHVRGTEYWRRRDKLTACHMERRARKWSGFTCKRASEDTTLPR